MKTKPMSQDEIFAIVRTSFSNLLGLPEENILMRSRLKEDLKVDSMFMLESGMILEEKFDILVPEEIMPRLLTVRQVVEFVAEKLVLK